MTTTSAIEIELQHISEMISDIVSSYKEDKKTAMKNYEILRDRLEELYETGIPMSEEGALERETNNALKIYMDIGKRLDKALEIATKLFSNKLDNHTKLLIADKIIDGNQKINAPIDFKMLK